MPLMAGTPLFNVLAGAGGAAQGYETAWEAAQKRDLEQQRINIESQKARSEDLYRQQLLNQRMISADPLVGMATTLGMDPASLGLKAGTNLDERYITALAPIFAKAQEQQQLKAGSQTPAEQLNDALDVLKMRGLMQGGDTSGQGWNPLASRLRVNIDKGGTSVALEPPPPEYSVIDQGIRAAWKADGNQNELTPDMPEYKLAFNYMVSGAQPLTEKGVLESKLNMLPNVFDAARAGFPSRTGGGPGPGGTPATGPQVTGTPPGTPQPPPEKVPGRSLIAPRQAPPGPVSPAEITQISGAIGARQAAENIAKAFDSDPNVKNYIGTYKQYQSSLDRRLPTFLGGKDVPPAVVDLEQNLSVLNNYVIHLITGAQVGNSSYGWFSQSEADRIKSELADQKYPPAEFQQRLANTITRMKDTEARILELGLRGNKDALLTAQKLGFAGGGDGGVSAAPTQEFRVNRGARVAPPGIPAGMHWDGQNVVPDTPAGGGGGWGRATIVR